METNRASNTPEEIFRRRLPAAREAVGLSQRGLVRALAESGMEVNQSAVARIERGERGVSLDEMVAISAVLDVAPVYMFLPIGTGPVQLVPALEVDAAKARRWARGRMPLDPANMRTYLEQSAGDIAFSSDGLSPEELKAYETIHAAERERVERELAKFTTKED